MPSTEDAHSVPFTAVVPRATEAAEAAAGGADPAAAGAGTKAAEAGSRTEAAAWARAGARGSEADDDALLAELRRVAAEADPVPERALEMARFAIFSRDPDAELAELVAVSIAESPAAVPTAHTGDTDGTGATGATGATGGPSCGHVEDAQHAGVLRSSGGPPERGPLMLSFAGGGVHVDLEVTQRGRVVDVVGQLVGAVGSSCTIEDVGSRRDVELDAIGRFSADGLRSGPIRLHCRSATGGTVTTAWTTV